MFRSLLTVDTNQASDVYLLNRTTGKLGLISIPNSRPSCSTATGSPATGFPGSGHPVVSADGLSVAFTSDCPELTGRTMHAGNNLFVRDLSTHLTRGIDLGPDGRVTPRGISDLDGFSLPVAISGDGSRVLFSPLVNEVFPSTPTTTTPHLILRISPR